MRAAVVRGDGAYDVDDEMYWRTKRPDDVPDGFTRDPGWGPETWSCERYCRRCQHGLPLSDTYCWNCGESA